MSDEQNPVPPPRPTSKTSAVPLKKETVRITLKSDAPPPAAAPPTVPLRAAPPAPAPTISLTPPPRPSIAGAPPPRPAAGPPAAPPPSPAAPAAPRPAAPVPPPAPVGSKTIPLGQTPPRPATPVTRPVSRPGGAEAPPAQAGPKATVKLAPAAAPGSPVVSAPLRTVHSDEEDVEINEGPLNILSWLSLAAGIVALLLAVATMDNGPFAEGTPSTTAEREAWARGSGSSGFKLPMDYSPFDRKQGDAVISTYETVKPEILAEPTLD